MKKTAKWGAIVIGILFFIGLIMPNDDTPTNTSNNTQKAETHNISESANTTTSVPLFESTDEFRTKFNRFTKEINISYRINSISVIDGEVNNTFTYMFTDNVGIVGSINKNDGSIKSLLLTGQGDGTQQSGADIIFVIASLIAATDPSLSADDRGKIITKFMDGNNIKESANVIKNGIKYSFISSDVVGIMFAIDPA